jgi:ankyrin repeat protein
MDSPLHAACMRDDAPSVRSLLSGPHTSNDPDTVLGWAPLHFAAKYGRDQIVALLLAPPVRASNRHRLDTQRATAFPEHSPVDDTCPD